MWIRPKRMNGNPGIWAKETGSTWTIYSFAGIVAQGLSEGETKKQLKELELKVVPYHNSGRIKGETWSLKNRP